MPKTKTCPRCKAVKSLTDFNNSRSQSDGKQTWCKDCHRDYRREREERLHGPGYRPWGWGDSTLVDTAGRPAWEQRIMRAFEADLVRLTAGCLDPDVAKFICTWRDARGKAEDWRGDVVNG